ncbi:spermatogenesis associated 6-like protein isoform X4 [Oryzias melastigma]|uniref:spermatogenesis associated 6-like protein isoform X4 n=1 Tax=Oryzias melastigma TaxID=30732 RepID=UPI00168D624A|nr:spermatogenesis associated 6-like protein isoform X4 [Oryzias melastigma]
MIPGLQKAFKVRVEIKFRAVSCPGVKLPAKEDMYLSVFVTGQYHQSQCLPAVFPLLFQEKMTFEKIFRYAFDPGDVAVMLEHETIRIELIQLIPPGIRRVDRISGVTESRGGGRWRTSGSEHERGDSRLERVEWFGWSGSFCQAFCVVCEAGHLLASFEENTRNFLFPEPKLVRPFSGVDREALMMRAPYFPVGQIPQEDCGSSQLFQSPDSDYNPDPSALFRPNRTTSESHRVWEEVHERVRGLLTTPKAVRRLIYGASVSEVDEVLARRSFSPDLQ